MGIKEVNATRRTLPPATGYTATLPRNPHDPDLPNFRQEHERWRRIYLTYGRSYFFWSVFVLRKKIATTK